jgi:hypothetical protein
LAIAIPSMASEWPAIYLVPAWIETSTPWASGWKKSGVAQVLSIITVAAAAFAARAIAGTSATSKVSEPGDSRKTSLTPDLISRAMSAPSLGSK